MVSKRMRFWMLLAFAAGALHAASIRGTVVENQSGRPLGRALVTLEPIAGTTGQASTARANVYGAFEFSSLAGGAYLVTASRRGFAPIQYGQKRWKSQGIPVVVEPSGSRSLNIRLPRFGAIAGTVLDENEVGLPEHDVVVYRATRPPRLVARARSDDRGRYRIAALEPGKYLVRTVAHQYEEGGYVPTFFRDTSRLDEAVAVDVDLDQQVEDINIRPAPGRLATLSGQVVPPAQVNVTLVSDTGAETTLADASGNFQFAPTAPGQYELYAQASADPRTGVIEAAYQSLTLDRDRSDLRLSLRQLPQIQFVVRDNRGQIVDFRSVRVLARRKDLAGSGKPQTIQLPSDRLAFLPGRWDVALASVPGYFVAAVSGARPQSAEPGRADGWNEILLGSGAETVEFELSPTPGALHGTVLGPRRQPVPGAPVYLEEVDVSTRRRVREPQATRADVRGQYQFADLAPGSYRVLASFDFEGPDAPMDAAGVRTLRVEESRDLAQDLELIEIP